MTRIVAMLENQIGSGSMITFNGATLMITGGTGSFGNAVLKKFLTEKIGQVRIFSRDEKKQDDMRHDLQSRYGELAEKVKFYIGDVRDPQSVKDAMTGVDYLFHAAALKQVPSCEFFPMQAVKTNIEGTDNVLHAATEAGVRRVVCLSTDKAAYPINAMGISKAMMERIIYANARIAQERSGTVICCTRYGNVMCSRGSVIPLFIDQIRAGKPLTITNPDINIFTGDSFTSFAGSSSSSSATGLMFLLSGRSFVPKSISASIPITASGTPTYAGSMNVHPLKPASSRSPALAVPIPDAATVSIDPKHIP